MDHSLVEQFHQLGLMGIEIPEQYGGGGGTFFEAILAVEELSRVDPSVGVLVDVQNTLVNNALIRWGTEAQKQKYLPKMAARVGRLLCAQRGGQRLGCLCSADARRGQGRSLAAQRAEAVDHQRQGIQPLPHHRHRRPQRRLQGNHRLHRREGLSRLQRRQKGGQARHPRFQHHRTDS